MVPMHMNGGLYTIPQGCTIVQDNNNRILIIGGIILTQQGQPLMNRYIEEYNMQNGNIQRVGYF